MSSSYIRDIVGSNPTGPTMKIQSLEEIMEYLTVQAELRSAENDEGGCIIAARNFLIDELNDLDDYDHLNKFKSRKGVTWL
jgi:hypothetical protein